MRSHADPEYYRERFYDRVRVGDGRWEWTGGYGLDGYGKTTVHYRTTRAHRAAWALERGPIPDGALVLHRCDNPRCVRASHLFLGTQLDNMRDRAKKRRHSGPLHWRSRRRVIDANG
jgi:HNH endonuclease